MKQTIEYIVCDLCKQEYLVKEHLYQFECRLGLADICKDCTDMVMRKHLDANIQCPACKGKGETKEYDGYNSYNWEPCRKCRP